MENQSNQRFNPNQQSPQPNQFGNRAIPDPQELAKEELAVQEKMKEINCKNIIKLSIIIPLALIAAFIVGIVLWTVIQIAGDQGSIMIGRTIRSWFNGNISLSSFIKLFLAGLSIVGVLYTFNKFFNTKM